MSEMDMRTAGGFIRDNLRLKTFPVAVGFLRQGDQFPEKTRRPLDAMGKRITLCQGVTMARNYGWTVGLTKEDNICVPAAIAFGFSEAVDPAESLAGLFCEMGFFDAVERARNETAVMSRFEKGEIAGIVLSPLEKASFVPDVAVLYCNPAQMMRLAQAWSFATGRRLVGEYGGKLECDEYFITPYKTQSPRVVIPGNGERVFAAVQDDEMVLTLPGSCVPDLVRGLQEAGKTVGARYPITPYQNFQPELPKAHKKLGKELGIL